MMEIITIRTVLINLSEAPVEKKDYSLQFYSLILENIDLWEIYTDLFVASKTEQTMNLTLEGKKVFLLMNCSVLDRC